MKAALVVAGAYALVMLMFWRAARNAEREAQPVKPVKKPYAPPTITEIEQLYEMAGVPMPKVRRHRPPMNFLGDRVEICLPEQPVERALDAYLAVLGHRVQPIEVAR